jgi:uncharacterized protein (TIGR02466 family)
MVFINTITPFVNSIYQLQDLGLDLNLIKTGVQKHLQYSEWTPRNFGKQTINLIEVIPEFKDLFKSLDESVVEILKSWSLVCKPRLSLHFINIDNNYSYSQAHCHINCILSGVFYVSVPEGSGDIVFYRPDSQEYQVKISSQNNQYVNTNYTISPVENMALIFPSHIKHGVGVSRIKPDESRISIAFDYVI